MLIPAHLLFNMVVVFRHRKNIPVVLLQHTLGHRPHSSKPNIVEATAPQVVIAFGMITTTTVSGAVSTRATLRCQKLLSPRSFFTSHQAHYRHRQAGSSSTIRRPKSLPSHGVRHLPQNRTSSSSSLKPLRQTHSLLHVVIAFKMNFNRIASLSIRRSMNRRSRPYQPADIAFGILHHL